MLVDVALVCGQHLNLLLHAAHAGALFVGLGLRAAQRVFQLGQAFALLFGLGMQQLRFFFAVHGLRSQGFNFGMGIALARSPVHHLFFQLTQPLLNPLAAFYNKSYFCFQAAYFGAGLIQQALRLVDMVACAVVGLAHGFQLGLNMAHIGYTAFQVVDGFFLVGFDAGLLTLGVSTL